MRHRALKHIWLPLLLLGLAPLVCCTQKGSDEAEKSVTELTEPGEALGEHLMIALAQAQNFHHKADVYLENNEMEPAITAVREILNIRFPADSPEAEDVLLDARARLGKLLVTAGRLDEAAAVVEEGLTGASRPSFFLANLHTVRGQVHEAVAVTVEESDAEAAKAARVSAIEAFSKSISINEALLETIDRKQP